MSNRFGFIQVMAELSPNYIHVLVSNVGAGNLKASSVYIPCSVEVAAAVKSGFRKLAKPQPLAVKRRNVLISKTSLSSGSRPQNLFP